MNAFKNLIIIFLMSLFLAACGGISSGDGDTGGETNIDTVEDGAGDINDDNAGDTTGDSRSLLNGVWRDVNGSYFNYLAFSADGGFLYVENDSQPGNGLELGNYTYDAVNEKVTFTINYDDNDPGNDSGAGDIGAPITNSVSLSNNNQTLSIETLSLSKVDFSNASGIVGTWKMNDSEAYLFVFNDNTFLLAEDNGEAPNGVDVGTYTYVNDVLSVTVNFETNKGGGVENGDSWTVQLTNNDQNMTLSSGSDTVSFERFE